MHKNIFSTIGKSISQIGIVEKIFPTLAQKHKLGRYYMCDLLKCTCNTCTFTGCAYIISATIDRVYSTWMS